MPLCETEAIVLRTYRLGEADKIVSLLTRQLGRVRAVASGAQRPKSRYGGALEPLSYVRLWIFERENRDLLRLNSAEVIESFFEMQREYAVQLAAHYLAEVAERMLPEREVNERSFRLLLAVLRGLKRGGEIDRPLLYFNYWILLLAGFLPDLDGCTRCGQELGEKGFYGAGSEGLLCAACSTPGAAQVSHRVLSSVAMARKTVLEHWMEAGTAGDDPSLRAEIREARRFFEEVIEAHVERKLVTRGLLAETM